MAIDTSCDDTSAAVLSGWTIFSNVVASQTQLHKQYGGVFPTVAKQAHRENIDPVVRAALHRAGIDWPDITAIAVTRGPGLAPALEVGLTAAQHYALEHRLPVIPVNHIEGHIWSPLVKPLPRTATLAIPPLSVPQFPLLSLVVSGGHTEFVLIRDEGSYERLGYTVDDAAGEALDKFGRMVDLGYPAGPAIELFAKSGDPKRYPFPLPMTTSGNFHLSFSGLKTAARNFTESLKADHALSRQEVFDLCASFQYAVFHAITYKLDKILLKHPVSGLLLGGGVASNQTLRRMIRHSLRTTAHTSPTRNPIPLLVPYSKRLCIDNAAMIGAVAGLRLRHNPDTVLTPQFLLEHPHALDRRPRWEVGEETEN